MVSYVLTSNREYQVGVMRKFLAILIASIITACAAIPRVTTIQPLSDVADAPYGNILVVSLFKSFDLRRYLEDEIVDDLQAQGIRAVASTSMMDTTTPLTPQTFQVIAEALGSDAVLVTQLVSFDSKAAMKDQRPEATYNVRDTYYYNVWSVDLTEYVEPPELSLEHSVVLGVRVFSVKDRKPVYTIELESKIARDLSRGPDYSIITDEAAAISRQLVRDGLVSP